MQEGWNPGCYYNENFNYVQWKKHYGNYLLNVDGIVSKFKDVSCDLPQFFIRPCEDFSEWQENTLNMDSVSTLNGDTLVVVAEPKNIYKEYRFFIVDKKIATCSSYRMGYNLNTKLPVELDAIYFVNDMIKIWCPHDVFVMDVAMTEEGYKIIEINCANGAGFYNCDVSKLVQTINDFEMGG